MSFPQVVVDPKGGYMTKIKKIPELVPTDQCQAIGIKQASMFAYNSKDTLYPNPYNRNVDQGILKGDPIIGIKGDPEFGCFAQFINIASPDDILLEDNPEKRMKKFHKRLHFIGFAARKIDNPVDKIPIKEAEIGVNIDLAHTIENVGEEHIYAGDWIEIVYPTEVTNIRTLAGFRKLDKNPNNIHKKVMEALGHIEPKGYGIAKITK